MMWPVICLLLMSDGIGIRPQDAPRVPMDASHHAQDARPIPKRAPHLAASEGIRFRDGFEEPDWNGSALWSGDLNHVAVKEWIGGEIQPVQDPESAPGRRVLALDAPSGGKTSIMVDQEGVTGEWTFKIGQDFSPSDANRAWFFLMSDAPLDQSAMNGYAVRTGESGSDKRFRLFRFDEGTPTELLSADLQIQAGAYEVSVSRDRSFGMSLSVRRLFPADSAGGWIRSDTVIDATHQRSAFAGFHFVYSVTRRDRSWVDDVAFTTSPGRLRVAGVDVINQNDLDVRFSHGLDEAVAFEDGADAGDGGAVAFLTDSLGVSIMPVRREANGALLKLRIGEEPVQGLRDGAYLLRLAGWKDRWGAMAADTLVAIEVRNPFRPQRFSITDSMRADLLFTTAVSGWRALAAANLGGAVPSTVDSLAPGRFTLLMDRTLAHGAHALTLPSLLNGAGWRLEGAPDSLVRYHRAAAGDLRITELLFDLSRHQGAFVELTAAVDRHMDLAGWQLIRRGVGMDRERPLSWIEMHLRPGEAVAVTSPTSAAPDEWPEAEWLLMTDFPGLNRSVPDQILLLTPDGEVSDSVAYDPRALTMDGRSLERRRFDLPAWVPGNWAPSNAPLHATPGRPNQPVPDTVGPVIFDARFEASDRIAITFDEWLGDALTSWTVSSPGISVTPSVPLRSLAIDRNQVLLDLQARVLADEAVTLAITGITDLFGNRSPDRELMVRYHDLAMDPRDAVLILTEFMPVSHAAFGEYIELWNAGTKAVALSSVRIDVQSISLFFDPGLVLRPGGRLVAGTMPEPDSGDMTGSGDAGNAGDPGREWILHPRLVSIPDRAATLSVRFSADASSEWTLLDQVVFDQERWGSSSADLSFQKRDPFGPASDPSNWRIDTPSPGTSNPGSAPDLEPPSILASIVSDTQSDMHDTIEILFSEFITLAPSFTILENDQRIAGAGNPDGDGVTVNGNRLILAHGMSDSGATLWVEGITDHKGNAMTRTATQPAKPPSYGDLRITETMFDPIADPRDGRPDQPQFIELLSIAPHPLRLDSVAFHLGADETGAIRLYAPLCDACALTAPFPILRPGGFAVIHPEELPEAVAAGRLLTYFGAEGLAARDEDPLLLRYPAKTLSMSNRDGLIVVQRNGTPLDSAVYGPSHHHRFIADHSGRSLEKIRADLPGTESENWGTSASPLGGTPGVHNSIAMLPSGDAPEEGVTLSPNPFSPDDDGFEDQLQIHIVLEHPDEMIRIRIYDLQGRLLRTLAEGEGGPTRGIRFWDGRDGAGRRLPSGLYILLVETRRQGQGPRTRHKAPVILAGRAQSRSP